MKTYERVLYWCSLKWLLRASEKKTLPAIAVTMALLLFLSVLVKVYVFTGSSDAWLFPYGIAMAEIGLAFLAVLVVFANWWRRITTLHCGECGYIFSERKAIKKQYRCFNIRVCPKCGSAYVFTVACFP